MIYLDLVISTPDPKIEITPQEDHKYAALRFEMNKPRISLYQLLRLRSFINDSRKKLEQYEEADEIVNELKKMEEELEEKND